MKKKKIKIFISYASTDKEKAEFIKREIDDILYEGIIVDKLKEDLKDLADKIAENIHEARGYVVLLTQNSYKNIWVNQEIGFAYAKFKFSQKKDEGFYHLVDEKLLVKLKKGFIHNMRDCNAYNNEHDFEKKVSELVTKIKGEIKKGRILASL